MANYLEKYKYEPIQAANTNIDQIAKTYQMKLAYWEQGASQVKAAYQNNLGLELTLDSNKQALTQYMKTAKDQLQKMSQTDLSIGENVTETLGIFDPITQDKALMGDHAITSFYKGQFAAIEDAKKKDDGKGYSAYNEAYVKQQYNQFSTEGDRDNWQKHWGKKKAYEPYYDYSKEQSKILDDCAPNSLSETTVTGMYLQTETDKSLSSIKLQNCLQAGLSSKARRQLEIEGAVTYGNDAVTLGKEYVNEFKNRGLLLEREKAELAIKLDEALKGTTPRHQELATAIRAQMDDLDNQVISGNKTIEEIKANDYRAIVDNYETVAGQVYNKKLANQYAQAFAYKDLQNKTVADPVGMLFARQNFEAGESQKEREFQMAKTIYTANSNLEQEYIKAGKRYKKDAQGNVILDTSGVPIPLNQALTEGNISENDGVAVHQQAVENAHKEKIEIFKSAASSMLLSSPTIKNFLNPNSPTTIVKNGKVTLEDGSQVSVDEIKNNSKLLMKTPLFQSYLARVKSGEDLNNFPDDLRPILTDWRDRYTTVNNKLYNLDLTSQLIEKKLKEQGYDPAAAEGKLATLRNNFGDQQLTFKDSTTGKAITINKNNIDRAVITNENCKGGTSSKTVGGGGDCDTFLTINGERIKLGADAQSQKFAQLYAYQLGKSAIASSYNHEKNKLMAESMYAYYQQSGYKDSDEALATPSVRILSDVLDVGEKETSKFKINNIVTDRVGTAFVDIIANKNAFDNAKSASGKEKEMQDLLNKQGLAGAIVTESEIPGHYRVKLTDFRQAADAAFFNTPKDDNKYKAQIGALETYKALYGAQLDTYDHHDLPIGTTDGKSAVIRMMKDTDGSFVYIPMVMGEDGNLNTINEVTSTGAVPMKRSTPEEVAAIIEKQAILNQRKKK